MAKAKIFLLDEELDKRFRMECAKIGVFQSDIIRALIERWLDLKSVQRKKDVDIYKTLKNGEVTK